MLLGFEIGACGNMGRLVGFIGSMVDLFLGAVCCMATRLATRLAGIGVAVILRKPQLILFSKQSLFLPLVGRMDMDSGLRPVK
jgi:hypothetical protein